MRAGTKARLCQTVKDLPQVDEFVLGGFIQNAKDSVDSQAQPLSHLPASPLVDQQAVGSEIPGQCNGVQLTWMEFQIGVDMRGGSKNEPTRGRACPLANWQRSARVAQFRGHSFRHIHCLKECRKHIDRLHEQQVVQWGCV